MDQSTVMQLINVMHEIETKLIDMDIKSKFERNLNKFLNVMEEGGYRINNPLGEKYSESRTDCEANIVGDLKPNMKITKVMKPTIYSRKDGQMSLIQKAIVIVEK